MPVALRSLSRKPKPRQQPESDPRFAKIVEDLKQKSAKVKQHPTPKQKAAEAQAAAKGPPNERAAGGKAKQVDKIKDAKTKKPEPASFLTLLRAEIEKAMPKTLGDTEKFMKGGDAGAMKGSLKGNVSQQKQEATGDVSSASKQPPGEAGEAKQSTPIPGEPQPPNPDVDAAAGMPAPKPAEDVSLQDSKQDTEAAMADAEVTPTQLKKANDPRFSAVLTAKDSVGKQADTAPAQFRASERGVIVSVGAQAKSVSKKSAGAMVGNKTKAKSAVQLKQEAAKKKDELERKKVADDIEAIYNKTKTSVETKLATLETEVGAMFDSGTDAALSAMKNYVEERIFRYKLDRYLSIPIVGAARWVADQFTGLPDEVNVFYVEGRNLFTRMMDALVVRVANLVEKRLAEAKAMVAAGQSEIKVYVSKLAPNLRSVGESAQKEMAGRFKELEQGIENKKNELAQSLAQKYKEASEKADKALKEIQDSNKGLVAAFVEKLGEIIKILSEFKDKLMALLKKGADAIKLILADPIGFLSNLIGAIKQGFNQFKANIKTWLIKGLIGWLFGALASAGVTPPADFSLPSIFKLVMQILGLTYENMRAKAVKLLGPTAVTVIEKLVDYVKTFITGGPAKLWEQIKGDLANLKEMVLGGIRDMIIETVIKAAVTKLLSMFNPAGAIIQAIMAIYNTVMFVIEQGAQIMAFVEAIINSVMAIAQGAIGAAATKVEQALGSAVPLVIGFLARLVGLGDIPKRATATVKKVQAFIDAAIDKFIGKAIAFVKKMFGKGGKDGKEDPEKQKKVDAGLAQLDAEDQKAMKDGRLERKDAEKIAAKVKSQHKVFKSITVKDGGQEWLYDYVASPGLTKKAGPKAKSTTSVKAAAKAAKKHAQNGSKATKSGKKNDREARKALEARAKKEGATIIPTKGKGEAEGPGLDAALLTTATDASGNPVNVVEFIEFKGGKTPKAVSLRSSSRPVPAGKTPIQILPAGTTPTRGMAAQAVGAPGSTLPAQMVAGQVLVQGNKLIQNQLSAITENIHENIIKMMEHLTEAIKDGDIDPTVKDKINSVLAGKGGVIRFTLDLKAGANMSVEQKAAAEALVNTAFDSLKAKFDEMSTTLDIVINMK
jgi:hypothetical protein